MFHVGWDTVGCWQEKSLWNWDVDDLFHSALLNPLLFNDLGHMDNLLTDNFDFLLCHLPSSYTLVDDKCKSRQIAEMKHV